jgi:hypothetical protein
MFHEISGTRQTSRPRVKDGIAFAISDDESNVLMVSLQDICGTGMDLEGCNQQICVVLQIQTYHRLTNTSQDYGLESISGSVPATPTQISGLSSFNTR